MTRFETIKISQLVVMKPDVSYRFVFKFFSFIDLFFYFLLLRTMVSKSYIYLPNQTIFYIHTSFFFFILDNFATMRIIALRGCFLFYWFSISKWFSLFQVCDSHLFQNGFQNLQRQAWCENLGTELLPVSTGRKKQVNLAKSATLRPGAHGVESTFSPLVLATDQLSLKTVWGAMMIPVFFQKADTEFRTFKKKRPTEMWSFLWVDSSGNWS